MRAVYCGSFCLTGAKQLQAITTARALELRWDCISQSSWSCGSNYTACWNRSCSAAFLRAAVNLGGILTRSSLQEGSSHQMKPAATTYPACGPIIAYHVGVPSRSPAHHVRIRPAGARIGFDRQLTTFTPGLVWKTRPATVPGRVTVHSQPDASQW